VCAAAFFRLWSLPLLYLSIVLVLLDIHAAVSVPDGYRDRSNSRHLIRHVQYGLFGVMMALGTASAALDTWYIRAINRNPLRIFDSSVAEMKFLEMTVLYENMGYAFDAVCTFTALDVFLLALMVHKVSCSSAAQRATRMLTDAAAITKVLLHCAVPLYVCYLLEGLVFVILLSPSVSNSGIFTVGQVESLPLVDDALSDSLFTSIVAVLACVGMSRRLDRTPMNKESGLIHGEDTV